MPWPWRRAAAAWRRSRGARTSSCLRRRGTSCRSRGWLRTRASRWGTTGLRFGTADECQGPGSVDISPLNADNLNVKLLALLQTPGSLSKDVPACIQFVPGSVREVVYSSPLLLGKVLVFDYRLSSVVRFIGLTQMVRSMHLGPVAEGGTDPTVAVGSSGLMAFGGTGGSVFLCEGGAEGRCAGETSVPLMWPLTPEVVALGRTDGDPLAPPLFHQSSPGAICRLLRLCSCRQTARSLCRPPAAPCACGRSRSTFGLPNRNSD